MVLLLQVPMKNDMFELRGYEWTFMLPCWIQEQSSLGNININRGNAWNVPVLSTKYAAE